MKPTLNRAGILLKITLALTVITAIIAFLGRFTGSPDTALALFFLCTTCVYVSLGAGLLVPIWMAVVSLFGANIERRRMLLLLSALNLAAAIIWIFVFLRQLRFRW